MLYKEKGLYKKLGVEVTTYEEAKRAVKTNCIDFLVCDQSIIRQVVINTDLIELIRKKGIMVFAIRPLAGG